jgi:mono/diheme cytochrome c family protein
MSLRQAAGRYRWRLMRRGALAVFALATSAMSACHRAPLPESGSNDEQLYAQRCGACHRAYQPSTLTPAMWQLQVDAMELKMNAAGLPLTPADKQTILAYLQRNASISQ